MTIKISMPQAPHDLKPRITVIGVGGAGGNAVDNMIRSNLTGVEFMVANTDAQALEMSRAESRIQLGPQITHGLGAGSRPDVGQAAAEEVLDDILQRLNGANMVFITAGMGGGTGTGAAPVIARAARDNGILTVGVVTKPFHFEGSHRMRLADNGIQELSKYVDTLIIIPNQNLFRIANEKTTFAEAFQLADDVLYSGVRGVTDLMVMPGLINLDFADIRAVMSEMGKAMMGTGEASGEKRATQAAEAAISNPLLDDMSMKGARGILINITGGLDMTLFEVDEAANRIRDEVDPEANIIFGATFDQHLEGMMRVSVVATGIDVQTETMPRPLETNRPRLVAVSAERPAVQSVDAPRPPAVTVASGGGATAHATAIAFDDEMFAPAVREPEPEPASRPVAAPAQEAPRPLSASGVGATWGTPPSSVAAQTQPAVKADRPFMAPPARVPAGEQPLDRSAGPAPERGRRSAGLLPSLLSRVTGGGRQESPAVEKAPSQPAPQPPAHAAQKTLGGLDPADRQKPSQAEEDLLEIPAFLRRQAN